VDSEIKKATLYSWRSRLKSVGGATAALIVTGILTRGITLLTQAVIAREFGLSEFSDAYFVTENVPELFLEFVAIGFSMVFIPTFTRYRVAGDEDEARKFASSFLFLSTFVSIALAVIAAAGAPILLSLMAPGFQGLVRQTGIKLVQIMSLSIVLLGLDAGIRGLLQSHREFVVPELGRVAYNSALFAFALILSSRFGVLVLGWGIVFGAVLQLVIQFLGALKQGVLKLVWAFDCAVAKRAAKQLLPFLIAISGMKIIFVLDRLVASSLSEGSVTALNYAGRIILLPVGIFALPLRTTFYPDMSSLAAQRKLAELAETVLSGLRILCFIVIPACVGLAALRVPLTRLLFERGAFDDLATLATSKALLYYAGGVPAIAAIFFLNNVYFSLGDPITLVKLNIFGWFTNLFLSLALSRYLGHLGIALATSISANLTVILMMFFLEHGKLKSLKMKSLLNSVWKIAFTSTLMGFLLLLLPDKLDNVLVRLQLNYQFLQVAILIVIGALAYLIAARLLRIDELLTLTTAFRKFFEVRVL
jgi:putative peptidoglycan lipid II flippase